MFTKIFSVMLFSFLPAADEKRIVVNISEQNLYAYEGEKQIFKFSCVTGKDTHPTLPGEFTIFQMSKDYRSMKYNADMPYSMFFSKDGKAIHAGICCVELQSFIKSMFDDLGADKLGSHGCVRLSKENAKTLFEWSKKNIKVTIVEK